ncbi:MAG: Zn-ribbon domain-containing OB-fold protein [Candidatus Lokiarchaeota archaeon]|nr:Zn-ribbon domain-containing OB-fold protein [Candidatus Lokiarchaeota archaeon]
MTEAEEKEFTIQNYLEFIQNKELMGSKCKDCGTMYVPVRKLCTACNSLNMEWVALSGKGELAAFTSITVGTPYFIELGYDRNRPYCFSVIKLKEGPMVSAQLVGVDASKPDTIKIGMPLKVKFLENELKGETKIDLGFEPA